MANTVKVVELMAESDLSWEDASMVALERARKTLRHIRSIDVGNFVALVADGEIESIKSALKWMQSRDCETWDGEFKVSS